MQAILCVSTSISGVYSIKITAENRDNDLISGYFGRSAEFRTLGLVVSNSGGGYSVAFFIAKIKEYQ